MLKVTGILVFCILLHLLVIIFFRTPLVSPNIQNVGIFTQIKSEKASPQVYRLSFVESLLFFWRSITSQNESKISPLRMLRDFLSTYKTTLFDFPIPIVMSGDYDVVKEIQNSEIWADRPIGRVFSQRCIGKTRGILVNNGDSWKILRKYTMKRLRKLGFGKKDCMVSFLEEELSVLISRVDFLVQKTENKIAIHDLFSLSVLNIVWQIATNQKFSQDDPHYNAIVKHTSTITTFHIAKVLLYEFPPLQLIINRFPRFFGYEELFEALKNLKEYFTQVIIIEQQGRENGKSSDNFISSFLDEIDHYRNNAPEDCLGNIFCVEELVTILTDLLQAGMDTTSNTLEGAIMLMIKFPEVQIKIQHEIDSIVGRNRFPSYFQDRQKMPYTCAAIYEIHRLTNIGTFNARAAREDCSIGKVIIKKGTIGFLQLHSLRMDENIWKDPSELKPERFLSRENKLIRENINQIMAFGGGVRGCPGEIVASSTIFTFLTGLLQRYSFSKSNDLDELRMRDYASLTNRVVQFIMSVNIR